MITSNRRPRGYWRERFALLAVTSAMPACAAELEIRPIAAPHKTFFKTADTSGPGQGGNRSQAGNSSGWRRRMICE